MRFGTHGLLALAIIVVCLAIAAADRSNNLWTKPRNLRAGAGHVEDAACSAFLLAKQAGVALDAANAAAHLSDTDRVRAGGGEDHRRQRCRE